MLSEFAQAKKKNCFVLFCLSLLIGNWIADGNCRPWVVRSLSPQHLTVLQGPLDVSLLPFFLMCPF